jgi:hypothetical protein
VIVKKQNIPRYKEGRRVDLTFRRNTVTCNDPKKDSQLSRADDWLNKAIDPSDKQEVESDKQEQESKDQEDVSEQERKEADDA